MLSQSDLQGGGFNVVRLGDLAGSIVEASQGDYARAHITVCDPIIRSPTSSIGGAGTVQLNTTALAGPTHTGVPPATATRTGPTGPQLVSPGPKRLLTFLNSPTATPTSSSSDAGYALLQKRWHTLSNTLKGGRRRRSLLPCNQPRTAAAAAGAVDAGMFCCMHGRITTLIGRHACA